ncbi:homoserine O-acetyltransferase/O-succinyltransferase family protein [Nocardia acidivorans]|uniref:homoserine O-acetyltransferase/O-succinyltransferase family protein n=1 Tax=Nocardia acidivorans TaxID=404580 RepID=UPI000A735773|nr:homoserine O-succinyltransferase [Nocardia acidivorans]
MVVRVGVVDLLSLRPDSMTKRVFVEALRGATERLGWVVLESPFDGAAPGTGAVLGQHDSPGVRAEVDNVGHSEPIELRCFGIDPLGSADAVDWSAVASMDALIISGSEPTSTEIADEPCLAIIDRLLRECSGVTSLLFSCQSAHAALHLLHGVRRYRLADRCHGVFDHRVHLAPGALGLGETDAAAADFATGPEGELTAGLTTPVRVPHSRWNVMNSADLRDAGLTVLLDSEEAEWQLAIGSEGLRHVFMQGHPEYLPDTMAREYRRDLRRWIADSTLPFPRIPVGYFPAEVHERLIAHAESVRVHRDPALFDELVLPADPTEVARDWSAQARTFFANWLEAVRNRRAAASTHATGLASAEPA